MEQLPTVKGVNRLDDQSETLGPLFGLDNSGIVALSIFLSFIVVIILGFMVVDRLLKKVDKNYTLWDLIYDAKGFPSLSKFQFLLWTALVLFCFTIVSFIRILSGSLNTPVEIPTNLIYLLGISIAVVPIASHISKDKYGETDQESDLAKKLVRAEQQVEYLNDQRRLSRNPSASPRVEKPPTDLPEKAKRKGFWMMITEGGNASLAKFQMFAWTMISVGIFILTFFSIVWGFSTGTVTEVSDVTLPTISDMLVALMGLSQGAYTAGKWVIPKTPSITSVTPVMGITADTIVAIKGVNFGNVKNTITLGNKIIDHGDIKEWQDTGIDFTVTAKTIKGLTGSQPLEVVVGGKKTATSITIGSENYRII